MIPWSYPYHAWAAEFAVVKTISNANPSNMTTTMAHGFKEKSVHKTSFFLGQSAGLYAISPLSMGNGSMERSSRVRLGTLPVENRHMAYKVVRIRISSLRCGNRGKAFKVCVVGAASSATTRSGRPFPFPCCGPPPKCVATIASSSASSMASTPGAERKIACVTSTKY